MVAVGVLLHAVGGFAAGSFYIPFKKVRDWAWESYWLVGGVFSWIVMPWVVALCVVPKIGTVLAEAEVGAIVWTYLFGVLWGVGGLTFGLSMRYLGMSLGYAIALGFCAVFGTVMPPIYGGTFLGLFEQTSGVVTLGGVAVCLAGIAICAVAGVRKERELSVEQKQAAIREFSFAKGVVVAVFAGVMSACMAFGFAAGKPLGEAAVLHGTAVLWQNSAVLVVVLAGGFTTNFVWCVYLNIRNRTADNYVNKVQTPIVRNYFFSALAGITWYLQFMFYGMGTTKMGQYDFSSWTIHMAFIIVFSNMWGLMFHEWRGSSRKTVTIVSCGIIVVLLSTVCIGVGNYLAGRGI
jgi:L-rhamnose-H+ transport protein